jgi:hypothetical protein
LLIYSDFSGVFISSPYFSPHFNPEIRPLIRNVAEAASFPLGISGVGHMDADLYRQRFAELIVRERDVTARLPAEFAAAYDRHSATVNRRHWVAAFASYSNADVRRSENADSDHRTDRRRRE